MQGASQKSAIVRAMYSFGSQVSKEASLISLSVLGRWPNLRLGGGKLKKRGGKKKKKKLGGINIPPVSHKSFPIEGKGRDCMDVVYETASGKQPYAEELKSI